MKRLTVIIFLFISSSFKSSAGNELYGLWNYEREFSFVKVDCANDSMYVLNQLPNFYYTPNFSSCFDNVRMKYYLCFGALIRITFLIPSFALFSAKKFVMSSMLPKMFDLSFTSDDSYPIVFMTLSVLSYIQK